MCLADSGPQAARLATLSGADSRQAAQAGLWRLVGSRIGACTCQAQKPAGGLVFRLPSEGPATPSAAGWSRPQGFVTADTGQEQPSVACTRNSNQVSAWDRWRQAMSLARETARTLQDGYWSWSSWKVRRHWRWSPRRRMKHKCTHCTGAPNLCWQALACLVAEFQQCTSRFGFSPTAFHIAVMTRPITPI